MNFFWFAQNAEAVRIVNGNNGDVTVQVRRQWNDWAIATYRLSDIAELHWSRQGGGLRHRTPRAFLHGYVMCDQKIAGRLSHSCKHGPPPHRIKICITKKGNEGIFGELLRLEFAHRFLVEDGWDESANKVG
jgi:hypothetical protein